MTFKDIFKSNFLDSFSDFSLFKTVIVLVFAFVLGLFITQIYKKTTSNVLYSTSFSITLIGMSMITAFVILAVTSNVVLSLGMVGALSIVRFRTAIKEPIDILYLFWSISVGIVLGANLIALAFIGSAMIGIVLIVFSNKKGFDTPYLIVLNCDNSDSEQRATGIIKKNIQKYKIKNKTISKNGIEVILEIRLRGGSSDFVNEISGISGVQNISMINYKGEYMN